MVTQRKDADVLDGAAQGPNLGGLLGQATAVVPCLGMWTVFDWIYWFNKTQLRDAVEGAWWLDIYVAMTVFMLAAFLVFRRRGAAGFRAGRLDVPMTCLMAVCTLSVAVNGAAGGSPVWDSANAVVAGVCMGWGYLRWAYVYAAFPLRDAVAWLALSYLVGSSVKIALDASPGVVGMALALLMPFASLLSLRAVGARTDTVERPLGDVLYRPGNYKPFVVTVACVFVLLTVMRLCTGSTSARGTANDVSGHLIEMGLSVLALLWVFKLDRPIDFPLLWRILFVFSSAAIVVKNCPWDWCGAALQCCNQVTVSLTVIMLWILLTDVSHHCQWHPYATFGFGWSAYVGSRCVVSALNHLVPAGVAAVLPVDLLGVWVLSLSALFLFAPGNAQASRFLADLQPSQVEAAEGVGLDARCVALAGEYGLTNRELDVLLLLSRGHSKAFIADELSLSENTVRNHAKHIYAKCGIHSRDDLGLLLDEA